MAWLYSTYLTEDNLTEKRRLLRLHIKEVSDTLTNAQEHTIGGEGFKYSQLDAYLGRLKSELRELESQLGIGSATINPFAGVRLGR